MPGTKEQHDEIRAYVAGLPGDISESADDFIGMGMTLDEVRIFIETTKKNKHAWWSDAADESAKEHYQMNASMAAHTDNFDPRSFVTSVSVALTEDQKTRLRAEFINVTELKFAEGYASRVEHAVAYAVRIVSTIQLRRMVPAGSRVVEIGPKPEHSITYGSSHGSYYGVMPVLSIHDAQRFSQAKRRVRLMLDRYGKCALKDNQKKMAQSFLDDDGVFFVHKKMQEVTHACDVVIAQDSNYDIPLDDCVDFMHRNGARAYYGSIVRCEDAAIAVGKITGVLTTMDFRYEADTSKDTLRFWFESSSFPYTHKLSVYRDYLLCNGKLWQYDDAAYVYTILEMSTESQIFFSIRRVTNVGPRIQPRQVFQTGDAGLLRIQHVSANLGVVDRFRVDHFDISEEVFSRIVRERLVATDVNDTLVETIKTIRTCRAAIIVNGVRISVDQPLAIDLTKSLAAVVKVVVTDMRQKGKVLDAEIRGVIRSGGYKHKGLFASWIDNALATTAAPGGLFSLVAQRIDSLMSDQKGLRILRADAYRVLPVPMYVRKKGTSSIQAESECICVEMNMVQAMLRGEFGGLTKEEVNILGKYLECLKVSVCDVCVPVPPVDVSGDCVEVSLVSENDESEDLDEVFQDAVDYISAETGQQELSVFDSEIRDACEELRVICTLQMQAARSDGQRWYDVLAMNKLDKKHLMEADDGRTSHELLRISYGAVAGGVVQEHDSQSFRLAFDPVSRLWVEITASPTGQGFVPHGTSELVYSNTNFCIWNQPAVISVMEQHLLDPLLGVGVPPSKFVNGLWGCGKTRYIINRFTENDAYCCETRFGAESVRRSIFGSSALGKGSCMTYDSCLLSWHKKRKDRNNEAVDILYLDELPMTHAAKIFVIIKLLRPRKVVCFGDVLQIMYSAYLADFEAKCARAYKIMERYDMNVTHRCALDVCAAALPYYGLDSGITVCDCVSDKCKRKKNVEDSLSVVRVKSVNQIPLEKDVKYLTFTHREQDAMQMRLLDIGITADKRTTDRFSTDLVSTVNEIQGATFSKVRLVRLESRSKPNTIYFREDQTNTALSRSDGTCEYYTTSLEDDMPIKWIERSKDERLRQIVRDSIKAGNDKRREQENDIEGF